MQVIQQTSKTAEQYAETIRSRGRGLFQSKELRDHVAVLLRSKGYNTQRRAVTGQQLHPEYVTDYVGTLEVGFGNTQYQTFWPKLYEVVIS